MKRHIFWIFFFWSSLYGFAQTGFKAEEHARVVSSREDGRFLSSFGIVHRLMKQRVPDCAFQSGFTAEEAKEWREKVRETMTELMSFPQYAGLPRPRRIAVEKRDGYTLEKWEAFPLPESVITFLVLLPDGYEKAGKLPAVLCIPGSGSTKEAIAGEEAVYPALGNPADRDKAAMARHYVKAGIIAVAVDNPASGEACDLERYTGNNYDYELVARYLLEIGWSYLGFTAYLDQQVLDWMKEQPYVNPERIIVSGFSLGTEPLMVLGVMNPSVYAFVYNDFLCRTKERMEVMTYPSRNGYRPFPNSICHLIPEFLCHFDFPDLVAALAPRYVICTEGGMDRDFRLIAKAFQLSGCPERFQYEHYPKFADPADRRFLDHLPEGINRDVFFRLANVDPPQHYFKKERVLAWLKEILN